MNKRERTNEEKKKKERKYKDKIEMKKEEGKMKGEKLGKKRNISIISHSLTGSHTLMAACKYGPQLWSVN